MKWLLAGTALGGFVLALLVLAFSNLGSHPVAQMARCSMGFLVSVVWIMAIADEVVNVLQVAVYNVSISNTHSRVSAFPDIRVHLWAFGCYHRPHDLRRR